MFFQVILAGLAIGVGLSFVGWLIGGNKGGLEVCPLPTIDDFRLQMKREGLILHKLSYQEGVEAYCEPKEEYLSIPKHWLKRF